MLALFLASLKGGNIYRQTGKKYISVSVYLFYNFVIRQSVPFWRINRKLDQKSC